MKSVHTQKSALKKRIGIVILGFLLAMNLCGTAPLFAAAVDLDNLMVNGGFEDSALGSSWIEWDPNHGDYLIDSGMYSEGNRSLKLTGLGTGAYMMAQNLSLIPGQKYTLTAKLYVPSGQESAPQPYIYVAEKGSTEVARENYYNITADTWHSCKVSFVYNGAEENFTQFQFRLNGAGTVYWDDIVLKPESLEPESNFLTNGSFEDGKNGWVDWNNNTYMPTPVKEHATDGDYSLKMQSDSWDKPPSIFQGAKVGEGNYMLRFKLCGKAPAAGGTIRADVLVEFKNEAGSLDPNHRFNVSFDELSEEMKEYAIPITANPGNPEICVTLRLLAKDCVGTVYWDNVRLEAYNAPAGVTFYNDESSEIFAPEAGVVRASYYAPPADAEQSVTLVAALFQISGNNMKLTSVSDPASDSLRTNRPCLAETELTIPDDGKNYMVQCFVWDSLDGMKPILKKSVLY